MSVHAHRRPLVVPRAKRLVDSDVWGRDFITGLPRWRAWRSGPRTTPFQIAFIGESTTTGSGMTAPGTTTPVVQTLKDVYGYHRQVGTALQTRYGGAGLGIRLAFRPTNDYANGSSTGFSFSAGWAGSATLGLFAAGGGGAQYATGGATATITLTGNRLRVFWYEASDSAAFTVKVDGVVVATLGTSSATPRVRSSTITLAGGGSHTIIVTAPSSGRVYLAGLDCYTGDAGVRIHSCAMSGKATTDTSGANMLDFLTELAPDLAVIMWTGNDTRNQTQRVAGVDTGGGVLSTTVYQNNLNAVCAAMPTADVLFVSTNPFTMVGSPQQTWGGTQLDYAADMKGVAAARGAAFLAFSEWWERDFNKMLAWLDGTDSTHPDFQGYCKLAAGLLRPLLA